MSTEPWRDEDAVRRPDAASEARLLEIRREAEKKGRVEAAGVRPPGAPFPQASPESGYYGIPMLKEPQWKWEVPLYFFVGGAAGSAAVIGAMAQGRPWPAALGSMFRSFGNTPSSCPRSVAATHVLFRREDVDARPEGRA